MRGVGGVSGSFEKHVDCFVGVADLLVQVCSCGVVAAIIDDAWVVFEFGQSSKASVGPVANSDGYRVVEVDDGAGCALLQKFVERDDLRPVGCAEPLASS